MKMICADIENFGKLSKVHHNFDDNFFELMKENGEGKSTLGAFLCAMFYGLNGNGKKLENGNEKMIYEPWQGGSFGGSITFEAKGKTYKFTRILKGSSLSFDIIDTRTNKKTNDYSEKIGEELFGVDREAFRNTVFIGQKECEAKVTPSIKANITGNAAEKNDASMLEKALDRIKSDIQPKNTKKYEADKSKAEEIIFSKKDVEATNDDLYRQKKAIDLEMEQDNAALEELRSQISKLTGKSAKLSQKARYDSLKTEKDKAEDLLNEEKKYFAKDIPSVSDAEKNSENATALKSLSDKLSYNALSASEKAKYDELKKHFENNIPTNEEIYNADRKIDEINNHNSYIQKNELSDREKEEFNDLDKRYKNYAPTTAETEDMINSLTELKSRKNEQQNNDFAITQYRNSASGSASQPALKIVFIILAVVFIAVCIGCIVLKQLVFSALAGALGIVSLVLAFCIKSTKKQNGCDAKIVELEEKNAEHKQKILEIENKAEAFLAKFGLIYDEYTAEKKLYEILNDVSKYNRLKDGLSSKELSETRESIKLLQDHVGNFFEKYNYSADNNSFSEMSVTLKNDLEKFSALQKKNRDLGALSADIENKKQEVTEFLEKYGFSFDNNYLSVSKEICDSAKRIMELERSFSDRESAFNDFAGENNVSELESITEKAEDVTEKIAALEEKRKDLEKKIIADKDKSEELNERQEIVKKQYDKILEAEIELEELKEKLEMDKKISRIADKTAEFLQKANTELTQSYMPKIKSGFDYYYELLTGTENECFKFNADLDIIYEVNSEVRSTHQLSAGYRDLIGLCYRMALVDEMFDGEKPFIVLDDPFTNLDDKKVKQGMKFLDKISEKYQVLYFTCHSSRKKD